MSEASRVVRGEGRGRNRTITVDVQNEATYFQLLGDGKAFLQFVFAFLLSLGYCFGTWPRLLPQTAPPGLRQKA